MLESTEQSIIRKECLIRQVKTRNVGALYQVYDIAPKPMELSGSVKSATLLHHRFVPITLSDPTVSLLVKWHAPTAITPSCVSALLQIAESTSYFTTDKKSVDTLFLAGLTSDIDTLLTW